MSNPFRRTAATASIAATTASANVSIAGHQGAVVAHNQGSTWAYFNSGVGSTTAATSAGYWLAPGTSQSIAVPMDHDYVAVQMASGTATVGITPGVGM